MKSPTIPKIQRRLNLVLFLALAQAAPAHTFHPPEKPAIPPLIANRYPHDTDGDRIDDSLTEKVRQAQAVERAAAPSEKSLAQSRLQESVDVELIFTEPVAQKQIDAFIALGGEITYLYKSVSYGWNGRLPLHQVTAVPAAMGPTLVLIEQPQLTTGGLLSATRSGRVRPIWAPGFAGSVSGCSGDTNITIAIVDSGVDETHPDLAGRGVYFTDFTDEPIVSCLDPQGHGTRVASIALGTGAAGGSAAGPLSFSQWGSLLTLANGSFNSAGIELPTNSVTVTATATWNGGDPAGTRLHWSSRLKTATSSTPWSSLASVVGTSPLTLTTMLTGSADRVYTPGLIQSNSITDFVVNYSISNYPATEDGFNHVRGVAPRCNWASARTVRSNFNGLASWSSAAVDDLIAQRTEKNIKLLNFSILEVGDPGITATLRQKINTAVHNGVLVVNLAGNDGSKSTIGAREIDDPGRAALALTVGAANELGQLTDYTSHGFYNLSSVPGQEEDYKPDLIAPGGSSYRGWFPTADSNTGDGPGLPDFLENDYLPDRGGTSTAAPFAAGCAALVMDAMLKNGVTWDYNSSHHSLFVKMVLCATASESNQPREGTVGFHPSLQRDAPGPNGYPRGKDPYEGYGMINPDAAVEAVSLNLTNGVTNSATFGSAVGDRRAWARTVNLVAGELFNASLEVPPTGDFDLYLYRHEPDTNGTPVMLATSTQTGSGVDETLHYRVASNTPALLVVKRISGSGTFDVSSTSFTIPQPMINLGSPDPNNFSFSFATVSGVTYLVEYKDSLDDPIWQTLQIVPGDGTVKTITDPLSAASQRFYRLSLQ